MKTWEMSPRRVRYHAVAAVWWTSELLLLRLDKYLVVCRRRACVTRDGTRGDENRSGGPPDSNGVCGVAAT